MEDAAEAKQEAEGLVQQLQEALQAKRKAIANIEKDIAPIVQEAQGVEAEVSLALPARSALTMLQKDDVASVNAISRRALLHTDMVTRCFAQEVYSGY